MHAQRLTLRMLINILFDALADPGAWGPGPYCPFRASLISCGEVSEVSIHKHFSGDERELGSFQEDSRGGLLYRRPGDTGCLAVTTTTDLRRHLRVMLNGFPLKMTWNVLVERVADGAVPGRQWVKVEAATPQGAVDAACEEARDIDFGVMPAGDNAEYAIIELKRIEEEPTHT